MELKIIVILTVLITVETLAQWCFQKTLTQTHNYYLLVGVVLYGVVGIAYYYMLKHGKKLAIANALWNSGSEISVAILGYLFFKQKLTATQLIAIMVITIAIHFI